MQVTKKGSHIYVAGGREGVDIYSILETGDVQREYTIEKKNFVDFPFVDEPYFIDLQVHQSLEYLFVLEQSSGLHVFSVQNKKSPVHLFVIPVRNGRKFELYQNTVVLIIQMQSIDFALQIFIDTVKKQHYFNRVFDNEIAINYVMLYRNFGIQISDTMNKVFYHSVYRDFVRKDWIRENWFLTTETILYGEFLEYQDQELLDTVIYVVSISGTSVNLGHIENQHPRILCYSKEGETADYKLLMNRTRCSYDTQAPSNYVNLFAQCQTSHPYTLVIAQPLVTDENINLIVGLVVGILLFVIAIVVACCCYVKKRNSQIAEMKRKTEEMRQNSQPLPQSDKNLEDQESQKRSNNQVDQQSQKKEQAPASEDNVMKFEIDDNES